MNNKTAIIVLCTAPDETTAQQLSKLLLTGKLAACITLLPQATSLYCWQGKMEQKSEVQMIIKSSAAHQDALLTSISQHHPYQVPELLVLPVQSGETEYLQWLHDSLT